MANTGSSKSSLKGTSGRRISRRGERIVDRDRGPPGGRSGVGSPGMGTGGSIGRGGGVGMGSPGVGRGSSMGAGGMGGTSGGRGTGSPGRGIGGSIGRGGGVGSGCPPGGEVTLVSFRLSGIRRLPPCPENRRQRSRFPASIRSWGLAIHHRIELSACSEPSRGRIRCRAPEDRENPHHVIARTIRRMLRTACSGGGGLDPGAQE